MKFGAYSISSGTLSDTGQLTIGSKAGTFTDTGGTATVASVSNAGTLTIGTAVNSSGSLTVTGLFQQTAGVTDVDGTLVLSATQGMLLSGGNLKGTGAISGPIDNISGDVAPGDSLGELTVTGNYTQGASGAMSILIAGAAAASQYDVLNLSGAAALGGTLNVTFDSSFTPYACEVFSFLATGGNDTGGNDTGQFATVNSNIPVQVNYFANGASITVLPEPSILATLCLGAGLLARRKKRLTTKR